MTGCTFTSANNSLFIVSENTGIFNGNIKKSFLFHKKSGDDSVKTPNDLRFLFS
jgi:hypothetical protein